MNGEFRIGGYTPGAIGRLAELHAVYYHLHWDFGLFFEAKVASELSAFLSRADEARDRFWTVRRDGRVEGAVAIDGIDAGGEGAHLRWFILSEEARGRGLGNRLMDAAMGFCDGSGYRRVYLWTFKGLDAARHLYEKHGFQLVEAREGEMWGRRVLEQRFERHR